MTKLNGPIGVYILVAKPIDERILSELETVSE